MGDRIKKIKSWKDVAKKNGGNEKKKEEKILKRNPSYNIDKLNEMQKKRRENKKGRVKK